MCVTADINHINYVTVFIKINVTVDACIFKIIMYS